MVVSPPAGKKSLQRDGIISANAEITKECRHFPNPAFLDLARRLLNK